MTIAFLNGEYLPLTEARISPMDRGFLFGDGIYEVIPAYQGHFVGFSDHMRRMRDGLAALQINDPYPEAEWRDLCQQLLARNDGDDFGLYLQVSRGAAAQRQHRYPEEITPTVFAYVFPIAQPGAGDPTAVKCWSVASVADRRWQRCQIKSVALLGNVMHLMEGVAVDAEEVLLFNESDELTEAAACNVFIVQGDHVLTPALDHQKLPGVTRRLLLDMMHQAGGWTVSETVVTRAMVDTADEIWLTSSTKEVAPVTQRDGHPVGDGLPGPVWSRAQQLFAQHRFDY
jgi:D-alanine transaminase